MPQIVAIYETVLYGDVSSLARFYTEALGLRLVDGPDELAAALRLPDGGILLLFDPERAGRPGRAVPSHGATGPGHVAFRVPRGDLEEWRRALLERGIAIDQDVEWRSGARSLYVRDPAGNSVELTEDELWPD